jgi:hypothetical protein
LIAAQESLLVHEPLTRLPNGWELEPLIDRVLGSTEQVVCSWRELVFPADNEESPREESLMETPGNLVLHGLSEVRVRHVATEDQVVIRKGRVPEKIALEPNDPFPKLQVDDKVPTLIHEVPVAKIWGQLAKAARRVTALTSPMQAAPVRIGRNQP